LGRSPVVTGYLSPLLQFARALPVVTMAPVFIVLFKIGTDLWSTIALLGILGYPLNALLGGAERLVLSWPTDKGQD
jgi:ABC-type nitrate/sulfonate/bicarbonate transport system permease component